MRFTPVALPRTVDEGAGFILKGGSASRLRLGKEAYFTSIIYADYWPYVPVEDFPSCSSLAVGSGFGG